MRLIDADTTKVSITKFFESHISHQKRRILKKHSSELCADMMFAIDAQLTQKAEPEWILCSEDLPVGGELVIVSCRDDSGDNYFDYTSCGWITSDHETWVVDGEENDFVVAWMPLPKPWKGENDENNNSI